MGLVQVAKGSEECAMAEILSNLLQANLVKSPVKQAIFRALDAVVGIHIEDIEVSLTLDFRAGRLTIHEGIVKPPQITIRTESGYVLDLSNISVRFGLPYFFNDQGKEVLRNIREGKIKMFAMPWQLLNVVRLTRVMSVQD